MLSSYISLILNTYSNLEATIEYIIKYTAILGIYIVTRDFIIENPNNKNVIINTLLISGILMFVQGLDNITYNLFEKTIKLTHNVSVSNLDNRYLGIFGYANTMAIYMLIISFFSTKEYLQNQGKSNKIFYNIVLFLSIIAIILSYSRSVWILVVIAYILIFIFEKNKKQYTELICRTGILSLIYSIFTIKLINSHDLIQIWILLIIGTLIVSITAICQEKFILSIEKIKKKYVIIILILSIITLLTIVLMGLNMTEPLELFDDVSIKEDYIQKINSVNPNQKYKITFDIDSKVAYNIEDNYEIEIDEINKNDDIIAVHKITFGNFKGQKNIEFESKSSTYRMIINFKTNKRTTQRGLTINHLIINDKEVVLKYKYLPKSIIEKIQNIKINTTSVIQRTEYMKDACKLIRKYGIFGIGADG